ncbi:MAG: hypothetical protein EPO08_07325 [Rhodospirillaceae bacterium]|nr:MAG: hypothetical protein EPO08_07325 [Rhodospirillaceae bacterium]
MTLRTLVGTVRDQHKQRLWLIRMGIGGLAAGLVLSYVLARALPLGVNTYIAAGIVGENRWDAGLALLRKSNPESCQKIIDDTSLVSANRDRTDACRSAAAKSKKDESCTINVPAGK